jgi:hypothetical protein
LPYDAFMPKRRDGIMTVRIPTDEKDVLQAIADQLDITLSDVVVKAAREFIATNAGVLKKSAPKSTKAPVKSAVKPSAKAPVKGKSGKASSGKSR